MTTFARPVSAYMTPEPQSVPTEAELGQVLHLLEAGRFSAVPVVDAAGEPVGVISRSDLVHLGLLQTGRRADSPSLPMPRRTAAELMTRSPHVVSQHDPLPTAAALMVRHHVHRVLVVERKRLVGVVSTLDLTRAVRDAGVAAPIATRMTSPVVTLDGALPISAADELLDRLRISAVVILEHDSPIGVFSQQDALACRHLPRDTAVGAVADPAMICLPTTTRLDRAAAHAAQHAIRRIIACEDRDAVGVLGGLDFARVVADG